MTQAGGEVATLATAVFAERRPSWSHQPMPYPRATPFDQARSYPNTKMTWSQQYDFRFVEGEPSLYGSPATTPVSPYTSQWISDRVPRNIDMLSLMSMSDAFFGRVFLARQEFVPFGTVSITTYFHAATEELAAEDITHVLATADARIFHRSYGDQHGELWSPSGRLLATTTQIAYFKAA
ncbi:MAG: thioesterase family protein, partial [Bradyrhizobium sp.]